MPRPPRLELAGVPLHVIQRGNNRAACFFGEVDRRFYLKCLGKSATRTGCLIHAYVLMTNHVHLLVTPGAPGAVGAMLQDIGRRYVRVINTIHGRTGTLWEGRFKSSLVDSERYLLTCHRYIELNPVRAGMVPSPDQYPWSSFNANAAGRESALVTRHAALEGVAHDYRALFDLPMEARLLDEIRKATRNGQRLGEPPKRRGRQGK